MAEAMELLSGVSGRGRQADFRGVILGQSPWRPARGTVSLKLQPIAAISAAPRDTRSIGETFSVLTAPFGDPPRCPPRRSFP